MISACQRLSPKKEGAEWRYLLWIPWRACSVLAFWIAWLELVHDECLDWRSLNTLFGHDLATWTTHETAQRQEVSSYTHWIIGQSVLLAHSSISARKDGHYGGLYFWASLLFVLSEKRRGCRTRLPRMKACPRWLCVYGSVSLWTALSLVEVYDEGAFAVE